MKFLLQVTALSATICTTHAADTISNADILAKFDALNSKFNVLEAKNIELEAELSTIKNKADKVAASPLPRRRELWGNWGGSSSSSSDSHSWGFGDWHDVLEDKANDVKDKVEKITQGLRQLYIDENLNTDDRVTVYEAGPIKYEVTCTGRRGIFDHQV